MKLLILRSYYKHILIHNIFILHRMRNAVARYKKSDNLMGEIETEGFNSIYTKDNVPAKCLYIL